MQIFTAESITSRPLLTSLANDDSLLIIDASDGNSVKRVTLSVLKAFLGSTSPTPNPTPTPTPSNFALRVNCGGGDYVDTTGKTWLADFGFTGGFGFAANYPTANTLDDLLFQSERYGSFTYSFTVPSNGNYTVNLLFNETQPDFQIGNRISRIKVNNQIILDNFDIRNEVNSHTALIKSFAVTTTSGSLAISTEAIVNNPSITAIEILG